MSIVSPHTLGFRCLVLAGVLAVEGLLLSWTFEGQTGPVAGGPAGAIRIWAPWMARGAVAFAVVFAAIAWLRFRHIFEATAPKWRPAFAGAHVLCLTLFYGATQDIYNTQGSRLSAIVWCTGMVFVTASAALAAAPPSCWLQVLRKARSLWILALVSSAVSLATVPMLQSLWLPASKLTFSIVAVMLRPFVGERMILRPERLQIGVKGFSVIIAPECSGLEGIGLLLVFGVVGTFLFRKELRFPNCLALFPIGIVVLFFFNALRIAALVLIGHWGAKGIAAGGFHSQAGWLAFNGVAFGLCLVGQRWPFVWKDRPPAPKPAAVDSTSAFLLPFVAVLFAGMLSRAMSSNFEWAYGLRVLLVASVLWYFRRAYAGLDWRPGWPAVAAGITVFFLWIGLDRLAGTPSAGLPGALAQAPPGLRWFWILTRSLGAIVTVPAAEELAFRAFLYRRLQSPEFDQLALTRFSWFALLASSAAFGVMHGSRWPAGILAGIAYAMAMKARGRFGDAVFAHSLTNALISAAVIGAGQWQLW